MKTLLLFVMVMFAFSCATSSEYYPRPHRDFFTVTVKSNNFNLNDLVVFCGSRLMTTIHNLNMTTTASEQIDYLQCNTVKFVARFLGGRTHTLNILQGPTSPGMNYCVTVELNPNLSMAIPRHC